VELTGNKYGSRDWRKLLSTRRGTALVAAGCAALAALILVVALQQYRHQANAGGTTETVLVATQAIPKGTAGSSVANEQLFKATSIVTKQVTAGAISDTAALQGKVASQDILPGQQLTSSDFTAGGGLAAQLAPVDRAMAVSVDSAHGMVGEIQTGDRVDVYGAVGAEVGGRTHPVVVLLARNIKVLKAGTGGSGGFVGSNTTQDVTNVTLNLPSTVVGSVALASDNGKVWLVLRPAHATNTNPPPVVSVQSLLTAAATQGSEEGSR
jgi:Flp pilus assembly protein CpaB